MGHGPARESAQRRSGRRARTARRWLARLAALALLLPVGCMPDVGEDPVPEAIEFDPSGTPARIPEPILLVVDPQTGRIDLGLAGIDVPADCAAEPPEAVAGCEFDQYLESLDGFPSLSPARAPATAVLDLATLEQPADLVVLALRGPGATEPSARPADPAPEAAPVPAAVGFDGDGRWLTLDPTPGGWPVGRTIVIAVRGYEDGVRAADGSLVVAAPLTALLKSDEPLTCGAPAAEIGPDCPYFALLEPEAGAEGAREALVTLETYRGQLRALSAWDAAAAAGLPSAEAAALWAFPIHSASVIELDPSRGLVPQADGPRTLRLAANGPLDPATLRPFTPRDGGTVFLLDLTLLEQDDFAGGLPAFTAAFDAGAAGEASEAVAAGEAGAAGEHGAVVLQAAADLVPGHLYGVLVSDGVTDPGGQPLVPSPVTVLLRTRGALVDGAGRATVAGVSDADAAELEAGRRDLAELLDDPLFSLLTGLTREDLVYVYAFEHAAPADAGADGEEGAP